MPITLNEVEHIAKLARLELSGAEKKRFQEELGKIIEYFHQLTKLDTREVPPMTHAVPMENVLREDKTLPSLTQDLALKNAPAKKGSYFQVPKVVEKTSDSGNR